jgi:hypothetical protein
VNSGWLGAPRGDVLNTGLPRHYDKPLYEQKCAALLERNPERDVGV